MSGSDKGVKGTEGETHPNTHQNLELRLCIHEKHEESTTSLPSSPAESPGCLHDAASVEACVLCESVELPASSGGRSGFERI